MSFFVSCSEMVPAKVYFIRTSRVKVVRDSVIVGLGRKVSGINLGPRPSIVVWFQRVVCV